MPQQTMKNWAVDKLSAILACYMLWQGVSILLLGNERLRGLSLGAAESTGNGFNSGSTLFIGILYLIPGLITLCKRTRKWGLLLTTLVVTLHAIGITRAFMIMGTTSISAVNTYFFVAVVAAWLYATERYAT